MLLMYHSIRNINMVILITNLTKKDMNTLERMTGTVPFETLY